MQKNETILLRIEEMNNLGAGVGKTAEGMVVFVPGAVSGDTVEATLIKVTATYAVARLNTVITPSPDRAAQVFCSAPMACGGCVYRHVTYEHEKQCKRLYIQNAFRKAGLPGVVVQDLQTTGQIAHYRNKAEYPVGEIRGQLVAGFYAAKTHNIIRADSCVLVPQVFSELVNFICAFGTKAGWHAYNEKTMRGILRHIYLRAANGTGEIMVCLVINGSSLPQANEFAEACRKRFPAVVSVQLNHNQKNTNVVLGSRYTLLSGSPTITDILCGKRFAIAPGAFYQVNHDAAEMLYRLAAEKAMFKGCETLLDLYCGIGTIGISLAERVREVIGVEIVSSAVDCATKNAKINNLSSVQFFCGDASDTEKLLSGVFAARPDFHPDAVILDPPRKGSTPALLSYLHRLSIPKIVYVSCGPDTLARDAAALSAMGYRIGTVTPVDLFPRTGHVEAVVLFAKE